MIDTIDRDSPRARPLGASVMRQRWAELLFLHWRVPAATLRALVPSELEIDTFEGDAYVGLVPFTMTDVRPRWSPPLGPFSHFHETNVRTYVHHRSANPGVWFFSLDAASTPAVVGARTAWSLPYHRASMSLERTPDGTIHHVTERRWPGPLPARCDVRYVPFGSVAPAQRGSLEFFLAERYILYAQDRHGGIHLGRVHHTPYPLQRAQVRTLSESICSAAGIAHGTETPLAHFAREVRVEVFALEKV